MIHANPKTVQLVFEDGHVRLPIRLRPICVSGAFDVPLGVFVLHESGRGRYKMVRGKAPCWTMV